MFGHLGYFAVMIVVGVVVAAAGSTSCCSAEARCDGRNRRTG